MRIAIVDFGSYAFTAQLARHLAGRGHEVLYLCFGDFQGPKGALGEQERASQKLTTMVISLGEEFQKYSYFKRRRQEIRLGHVFGECIHRFRADVAVGANLPIELLATVREELAHDRTVYIHWLQDIMSLAIKSILRKRFGVIGNVIGAYYAWREGALLRSSDAVIAITDDFFDALSSLHLDPARCHVIPNWAPLEDLPLRPKDNSWARSHNLITKDVLMYTGTMGTKHNPNLIIAAANGLRCKPNKVIVVISEGVGANYLQCAKAELGLSNLIVLPYQPIDRLAEVLGAADVLTAFVEPSAGMFSVPSKLLSYLCAARSILLAVPAENLAARIVNTGQFGIVVSPDDVDGYTKAAIWLMDNPSERSRFAGRTRQYAEEMFDISHVTTRFERIFRKYSRGLENLSDPDR